MPIKRELYDYCRFHKSIPHPSNYPIITNVSATSLGLVTWTTDVVSTSQVIYGHLPLLGEISAFDPTLVTSHSVQLVNLTSGYYYFRVMSFHIDALSISDLYVFVINTGNVLALENNTGELVLEDNTRIALET